MSIKLRANDPSALKKLFETAINAKSVKTWSLDASSNYVDTTPQWKACGHFHPVVKKDHILLYLVIDASCKEKQAFFAEAHGAMVYSMIYHCYLHFQGFDVSEWPYVTDGDSKW